MPLKATGPNIYIVGPVECGYDEFDSFIIAARTPNQAREWALKASRDQPAFKTADVKRIGTASARIEPGIILGSFNAG